MTAPQPTEVTSFTRSASVRRALSVMRWVLMSSGVLVTAVLLLAAFIFSKHGMHNWADYHAARPLCQQAVLSHALKPSEAVFYSEVIPETNSKIGQPTRVYKASGEIQLASPDGAVELGLFSCSVVFRDHKFVTARASVTGFDSAVVK